ncbi:hemerythrin domain-containing protein [Kitasatospora sp. NPDC001132]
MAEEQYLCPAVREHLEGDDRLADKELEDHSRVERILKRLENTDDAQVSLLLQQLMDEVALHVQDEENNLFPSLRQASAAESWLISGARSGGRRPWPPPVRTRPHRAPRPRATSPDRP